jgi:hypothetical protein
MQLCQVTIMKKTLLLSMLIASIAPLTAQALMTNDEVLSYAAMPLAVSNVCEIRGVQNDQVATLVGYMDQANVSPEGFIEVFRYVPVGLVFNGGRNPDFVDWVGGQVNQGVAGDELVTVMERRLTSYGNVVRVSSSHPHYRSRVYRTVYERDYVPVAVRHYCERDLLDRYALIDMPIAVTNVVDIGIPIARVGGLVVQLNLGYVSPLQTVEVLRYAPAALLAVDYGQPDFVQYVYTERVSGLSGYDLARVINRRFTDYGVSAQIDLATPVYYSQNAYVPSVVTNYVAPYDPAYVPPIVRTRMASYAPAGGSYVAPQVAQAPSPQVQRLLDQRGNTIVMNPAQARREIAQEAKHGNRPPRVASAVTAAPGIAPPPAQIHGRGHVMAGPPVAAAHGNGRGRGHQVSAPVYAPQAPVARPSHVTVQRGNGHAHVAAPARAPVAQPAPAVKQRGRPHATTQPVQAPPPVVQHGEGHGHGNGGGPPARVVAAPPAPVQAPPPQQHGNGNGKGEGQGQKKGKKQ